ncbi:MAG: DUF4291 domain-containing protein [bacterium]|nr:DUF4291 domain-containing protein [bacterium]
MAKITHQQNPQAPQHQQRQIRALFTEKTISVYQAYSHHIANPALKANTFKPPFIMERMTWIKPSFFWMMYRAGWGDKPGQERILQIELSREGFEWALNHACLSHYEQHTYNSIEEWEKIKNASPVRIQWDPERDCKLNKLDYRSIQIGLSGEAVKHYVNDWIVKIIDVTETAQEIKKRVKQESSPENYAHLVPKESLYPLDKAIASKIGISS